MPNWEKIANERLRALWLVAHAHGGRFGVGRSVQEDYPGDAAAIVTTYTDRQFGDFVIEARKRD
jgi:hypothetical protein